MSVKITPDPERAEDIIHELLQLCIKHKVVLLAGNGVFYLARVVGDVPNRAAASLAMVGVKPQARAIAQIREINPTMAEWMPNEEETKVTQ